MKNQIYEFLYLSRQERSGLFMIIFLSALISFSPMIYSFFQIKTATDFSVFQKEVKSFLEAENVSGSISLESYLFDGNNEKRKEERIIELFPFDPNNASKEDFLRLGISPKTVQTILNFRNKGAKFFQKEDFKKVYGL